ncbi:MAG: DUF2061 domain-containing protein [Candidatus Nanohaloarchaea archaeon]
MGLMQKAGKSISWRIHGTAATMLTSYIFTGSVAVAGSIAGAGALLKVFLYMYHEKLWEILEARGYQL